MEIRDPVHGTLTLTDAEAVVVDTPEYQRLRWIRQLGFSEFAYPAATHNRYLHSLGVCHLSGLAFEQIFNKSSAHASVEIPVDRKMALRQCLRLACLLHDVGHGPLSHVIEEVMPPFLELKLKALPQIPRKATHEDYTLKYLTDSPLTSVLQSEFKDFTPVHVACLVDPTIPCPDDFFVVKDLDFRPLLCQLVSSELDCDRMDYLERDSYFCGTNYGKFDLHWMLANLGYHLHENRAHLSLGRRALYTFDDFLISRHHMHLMVYFHHKSIIYEEMLGRYLSSSECQFFLPSQIEDYTSYTDHRLYEHLKSSPNSWAKRMSQRRPYKVILELHNDVQGRCEALDKKLQEAGIDTIFTNSHTRLSKYHSSMLESKIHPIFVTDQYDRWDKPVPLFESTEIFQRYEGARVIERIYVSPENFAKAERVLKEQRI